MSEKRVSARAIIIHEGKLVSMYREKQDRVFYTFPGGGMNEGESEEECVRREVMEEFGLVVQPIKKVYRYERSTSIEHFYLVEWISGEFGSGVGEEFQDDRNNGVYIPKFIEISQIPSLPLMPPEVASAFYDDFMRNGKKIRDDVKFIFEKI